jgi:hypothetical protein
MKKKHATVQEPAKIMFTQKTHRQPTSLEIILGTEPSDERTMADTPGGSVLQATHSRPNFRAKKDRNEYQSRGSHARRGVPQVGQETTAIVQRRACEESA